MGLIVAPVFELKKMELLREKYGNEITAHSAKKRGNILSDEGFCS